MDIAGFFYDGTEGTVSYTQVDLSGEQELYENREGHWEYLHDDLSYYKGVDIDLDNKKMKDITIVDDEIHYGLNENRLKKNSKIFLKYENMKRFFNHLRMKEGTNPDNSLSHKDMDRGVNMTILFIILKITDSGFERLLDDKISHMRVFYHCIKKLKEIDSVELINSFRLFEVIVSLFGTKNNEPETMINETLARDWKFYSRDLYDYDFSIVPTKKCQIFEAKLTELNFYDIFRNAVTSTFFPLIIFNDGNTFMTKSIDDSPPERTEILDKYDKHILVFVKGKKNFIEINMERRELYFEIEESSREKLSEEELINRLMNDLPDLRIEDIENRGTTGEYIVTCATSLDFLFMNILLGIREIENNWFCKLKTGKARDLRFDGSKIIEACRGTLPSCSNYANISVSFNQKIDLFRNSWRCSFRTVSDDCFSYFDTAFYMLIMKLHNINHDRVYGEHVEYAKNYITNHYMSEKETGKIQDSIEANIYHIISHRKNYSYDVYLTLSPPVRNLYCRSVQAGYRPIAITKREVKDWEAFLSNFRKKENASRENPLVSVHVSGKDKYYYVEYPYGGEWTGVVINTDEAGFINPKVSGKTSRKQRSTTMRPEHQKFISRFTKEVPTRFVGYDPWVLISERHNEADSLEQIFGNHIGKMSSDKREEIAKELALILCLQHNFDKDIFGDEEIKDYILNYNPLYARDLLEYICKATIIMFRKEDNTYVHVPPRFSRWYVGRTFERVLFIYEEDDREYQMMCFGEGKGDKFIVPMIPNSNYSLFPISGPSIELPTVNLDLRIGKDNYSIVSQHVNSDGRCCGFQIEAVHKGKNVIVDIFHTPIYTFPYVIAEKVETQLKLPVDKIFVNMRYNSKKREFIEDENGPLKVGVRLEDELEEGYLTKLNNDYRYNKTISVMLTLIRWIWLSDYNPDQEDSLLSPAKFLKKYFKIVPDHDEIENDVPIHLPSVDSSKEALSLAQAWWPSVFGKKIMLPEKMHERVSAYVLQEFEIYYNKPHYREQFYPDILEENMSTRKDLSTYEDEIVYVKKESYVEAIKLYSNDAGMISREIYPIFTQIGPENVSMDSYIYVDGERTFLIQNNLEGSREISIHTGLVWEGSRINLGYRNHGKMVYADTIVMTPDKEGKLTQIERSGRQKEAPLSIIRYDLPDGTTRFGSMLFLGSLIE